MKLDVYYLAALVCLASVGVVSGRSVIIANYHNVIMFFPKELGGNDDVRVVFDVRNVTEGTVSFNIKFNVSISFFDYRKFNILTFKA